MKNSKAGKVYLIGAGPGDPGLITVRGRDLLYSCQAVVYDNLVSEELIIHISPEVESYYVGKRAGHHIMEQEKINDLLLKLAREGKNVARLKGSDPLIFGRGGEEAAYLRENGIEFEIVPGVTAGIAAPAYAGIPCTDRERSSFVLFVTGHKATDKSHSSVPWKWVGQGYKGTVVIYMGVQELPRIVKKLIDGGYRPETPAAAIERGTYPTQKTVIATLATLPDEVIKQDIKPPTIFIIGEVVNLKDKLSWIERRPLTGLRVMVTRAADQADPTYKQLRELGAEPLPYPTIATGEIIDEKGWDALKRCTGDNNWLAFTSANGVRYFFDQLCGRGADPRHLGKFKIAAVGHGTNSALSAQGLATDFIPEDATVLTLAEAMLEKFNLKGANIIRVRGTLADDRFEKAVTSAGADCHQLTTYRTFHPVWPDGFKEKLLEHLPDAIMFTSRSSVDGLAKNLSGEEIKKILSHARIFSLGTGITTLIEEKGFTVTAQTGTHSIEGLVETIYCHFTDLKHRH